MANNQTPHTQPVFPVPLEQLVRVERVLIVPLVNINQLKVHHHVSFAPLVNINQVKVHHHVSFAPALR